MRTFTFSLVAAGATLLAGSALAADPYLVDQRNPQYQKSFEHLARASQALAVARKELSQAQAAYQLPGLNSQQMLDQLMPLEGTLAVLLSPEKKRMAHQTLVPDGLFFTPVQTGE